MTRPVPPVLQAKILLCAQGALPDPERSGRRHGQIAGAAIGAAAAMMATGAGLVPALLAPLAALAVGLPAALWLSGHLAVARARAEGWRLQAHVQPLPPMPVGTWATAEEIRPPPGHPAADAEAAARIRAESDRIRSPLVWTRQGPMAVLPPKPFQAAAWG